VERDTTTAEGDASTFAGTVPSEVAEVAAHVVEPTAEWRWTPGDTLRAVVAGLTLLIAGIVASRGVPAWEEAVFLKINGLPDWMYPVLWAPMQLGNVWVATGAAAVAGLLVRRFRSAAVLVVTPFVAWMVAKAIKTAVDRGRPEAMGLDVVIRGEAETGLGFISGHATVAFALAGALAAHLRQPWRSVAVGLAVAVAVARVYVGVHLPLDVIGGAACGLLIGEAARAAELGAIRRRARAHPGGGVLPAGNQPVAEPADRRP
jgi:membrane-associated phospholipid phosphatase